MTVTSLQTSAAELDAADPLAWCRHEFSGEVRAYLDGNSLGRPPREAAVRLAAVVEHDWGNRLIRSWDEQWFALPLELGDRLGRLTLGAAAGQTVIGDSTTVMLYKLLRAAVDAAPDGRNVIVVDRENFPTDRYIVESVASERGFTVRWLEPDPVAGVTPDLLAAALADDVAVVTLSHVAYKSGFVADLPTITEQVHRAGAVVLWDLCHSVGLLDVRLDDADVDLAVGCGYKFLCGGPGAPAFGYVAARLQDRLTQPIQGWMGHADAFAMGQGWSPGPGMRRFLSGTPPILAMIPLTASLDLIERARITTISDKARRLGRFAIEATDTLLAGHGVTVSSPREDALRGGHVTISHPAFREVTRRLWEADVIPDFRNPDGIRLGLAPLTTSFGEVLDAVASIGELLSRR
ncbi:kynureninase [Microlunatus soli]|uniref:Kynureninase n=1 Tax=Microlunatus soli TaxID=630515 RepID=A0A1H1Q5T4_9ACTN|nr:aminotransferase class V-fold PLP-dependent enzyme [Microlunatus soli]SDS18359.1 Kynureninase [Microlunatus soli]